MTTVPSPPGGPARGPRGEEELIEAALRQETGPPMGPGVSRPLPERIGPYKVVREIGAGGMGVVYEARQEQPIRRRVALKVIKLGMDTRAVVARFEAERQALALMDHPNIAKVFDAGATEQGQPYFAMEYVQGVRFTEYCDQQRLTTAERLALFVQVCQAIQHAHQKGIIHRDIKPSNVLVATPDDKPIPKVIDFGVAKATAERLTEKTLLTQQGQFVGTPEYMSPEQAGLAEQDIDTRADVYSLGVLLYELLVGVLPYGPTYLRSRGVAEIQRIIREEEPPKPSTRLSGRESDAARHATQRRAAPHVLRRQLRGELDWITMKALEKDRTRRYDSAADLAADIRRHLNHEPVLVGPPSTAYQIRKFIRRHRGLTASVAAVFLVLAAGITASTIFAFAERRARHETRQQTYVLRIGAAEAALSAHNVTLARQRLSEASRDFPEFCNWEWHYLNAACDESLTTLGGHTEQMTSAAVGENGELVVYGAFDGSVHVGDLATGAKYELEGHTAEVLSVALSPEGRHLASGSADNTVRVWDLESSEELWTGQEHGGGVSSVAFSPDGARLASGGMDDTVHLWDSRTGRHLDEFTVEVEDNPWGEAGYVDGLAFSPDGKLLAVAIWCDTTVRLWKLDTNEELWRGRGHRGGVSSVAFSPDGQYVAAGSQDAGIYIWTIEGDLWRILRGHTGGVRSVAFDPRSDPNADIVRLASASDDATIRIWDAVADIQLQVMVGHEGPVLCARFTPDGRRIVSGSNDGTVHVWDASVASEPGILGRHRDDVLSLAFSPDGTRLVSGAYMKDSTICIWDICTREMLVALSERAANVTSVAFSPDGTRVASGSAGGTVHLWDARTGEHLLSLPGHTAHVASVAFSPDGTRMASGSHDKTVRVWNAYTGEELLFLGEHADYVRSVVFSPDGMRLASASKDGTVRLWDAASGNTVEVLNGHEDEVLTVAFSPDGARLASGSMDMTVRIWNATNGDEPLALRGSAGHVWSVAFSPDGRRLAAGSVDRAVHMWDAYTGEELIRLRGHRGSVACVAFSPDGTRLASGSGDWTIRLWDTVPYRVRHEERQAILVAKPDAERMVDALWRDSSDPRSIAQRLRADASLSAPVRHAALNLVLQRASSEARPAPAAEQ